MLLACLLFICLFRLTICSSADVQQPLRQLAPEEAVAEPISPQAILSSFMDILSHLSPNARAAAPGDNGEAAKEEGIKSEEQIFPAQAHSLLTGLRGNLDRVVPSIGLLSSANSPNDEEQSQRQDVSAYRMPFLTRLDAIRSNLFNARQVAYSLEGTPLPVGHIIGGLLGGAVPSSQGVAVSPVTVQQVSPPQLRQPSQPGTVQVADLSSMNVGSNGVGQLAFPKNILTMTEQELMAEASRMADEIMGNSDPYDIVNDQSAFEQMSNDLQDVLMGLAYTEHGIRETGGKIVEAVVGVDLGDKLTTEEYREGMKSIREKLDHASSNLLKVRDGSVAADERRRLEEVKQTAGVGSAKADQAVPSYATNRRLQTDNHNLATFVESADYLAALLQQPGREPAVVAQVDMFLGNTMREVNIMIEKAMNEMDSAQDVAVRESIVARFEEELIGNLIGAMETLIGTDAMTQIADDVRNRQTDEAHVKPVEAKPVEVKAEESIPKELTDAQKVELLSEMNQVEDGLEYVTLLAQKGIMSDAERVGLGVRGAVAEAKVYELRECMKTDKFSFDEKKDQIREAAAAVQEALLPRPAGIENFPPAARALYEAMRNAELLRARLELATARAVVDSDGKLVMGLDADTLNDVMAGVKAATEDVQKLSELLEDEGASQPEAANELVERIQSSVQRAASLPMTREEASLSHQLYTDMMREMRTLAEYAEGLESPEKQERVANALANLIDEAQRVGDVVRSEQVVDETYGKLLEIEAKLRQAKEMAYGA
eukprot:GHVS01020622.1.p1 GENE.GHVS01020622.1~~GHVS01020622.1.p1  ORF type:complete len:804 (+),score=157.97 GHVS01020622.1:94-2412(+)